MPSPAIVSISNFELCLLFPAGGGGGARTSRFGAKPPAPQYFKVENDNLWKLASTGHLNTDARPCGSNSQPLDSDIDAYHWAKAKCCLIVFNKCETYGINKGVIYGDKNGIVC